MSFLTIVLALLVHVASAEKRYIDENVFRCMHDIGLSSFVQILTEANMQGTLTGTGPFTILAPNNAAFTKADVNLMGSLAKEPLLRAQVVEYHIVNGFYVTPQLIQMKQVPTIEGQHLTITGQGNRMLINNHTHPVGGNTTDIICNNGIIHVVDSVLVPPKFSTASIAAQLLIRDDLFRDAFMALLLNNLTHMLEVSEFTLFAPTDLAFGRYSELSNIRPDTPNAAMIYQEVFKYHMVPGRRTSYKLHDGDRLFTMHGSGSVLNITKNADGLMVDNAKVEEADIPASNGVIHAVDHILFPRDLLAALIGVSGSP
ncbi:periostin-like [Dreissena polymorpha]|uniref:FAS1 domain-containing protein n=1 Tax=Dreissena polymorpha TaxID=45954 RepID=A0A9D4N7L8_DREPO|nr:periostin-like [Dreissena polymorpha]KAH3889506.1 hypothetical protein DPMN_013563 [Dreissena polymorpha]